MKSACLIALSLIGCSAIAQNEHWDTYMAKLSNKPASVLVDMNLIYTAPDKKYPYLLITGPRTLNCNKQGLPDNSEINELEDILEATGNFISGVTPKVLTGTVTYNCDRLNYYYIKDTMGVRNAIARMYSKSYAGYIYTVKIKDDPEWKSYRTFLYPDEPTLNWMENDKIITAMMMKGDSLKKPMNVSFDLFFKTDTDRAALVVFAKQKGYKIAETPPARDPSGGYELVLSTYTYIKLETIGPMTEELKEETKKHHGFYNGWVVAK